MRELPWKFRLFLQGASLVFLLVFAQCSTDITFQRDNQPYVLEVSSAFPALPEPADNPLSVAGVALGRRLFYDPILSGDSTIACGSCHDPKRSFSDHLRFSLGVDKFKGNRNSMPIINLAWGENFFWDGRALGLEGQAIAPVENPVEMHESWKNVVKKLQQSPVYPDLFSKAFGTERITKELAAKALSQFERTLISSNSKYDQVLRKEATFTAQEQLGLELFFTEKADCFHCHGNIFFTDMAFHNIGLDSVSEDPGLENYLGRKRDKGKFKTPTLRNLVFTAPYMHDGRFQTLEEVIDFYSEGVKKSPTIDPLMKNVDRGGVHLNQEEKAALIAFLYTLTDSTFVNNPAFRNPFPE